jgi:Uncharacterized conserved protein
MKIKFLLCLILVFFFAAACGSDEENEEKNQVNDNDTAEETEDETPVIIVEEDDEDAVEDEFRKPTCYAGGAIIAEGGQQFVNCSEDPEKVRKQVCKNAKWVDEGDCVSATVKIPANSFKMGCDTEIEGNCKENAVPLHDVSVSEYTIDKFEVSVELFEKCIAANICTNDNAQEPHYRTSTDTYQCNIGNPDRKNHPANCVTWRGAKAYCEWLGKRLPTEAEWENAAKSGKAQLYPWGNSPEADCSNTVMRGSAAGCGSNTTSPIGSKPDGISANGIYDLSGNVAEYTNDWYDKNFYSKEEATQKDTQGPDEPEKETDKYKVVRGGSFVYGEDHARSSFRSGGKLDDPAIDFGFRCVSTAE